MKCLEQIEVYADKDGDSSISENEWKSIGDALGWDNYYLLESPSTMMYRQGSRWLKNSLKRLTKGEVKGYNKHAVNKKELKMKVQRIKR